MKAIENGNLKHCFAWWPYAYMEKAPWTPKQAVVNAVELGCAGIELFPLDHASLLTNAGLTMPLAILDYGKNGPAPFQIGWANKADWEQVEAETKIKIDLCAKLGFPNVIAFTGFGKPTAESQATCIEGLTRIAPYAAELGVTLCLEHLNSKDFGHPMKGHPGYMGHDMNWVADVVRGVGNQAVRLLFDLYHVQVMHPGKVMELLHNYYGEIGHVHVAQTPRRAELDLAGGEIDFTTAMRYLARRGYQGFIGQEFVPTEGRDPVEGLAASLKICDV